uniref:Uncharacterized protein n=1 Tax=Panagrolaimus sp. PS1159 TaxID=55785 RepID=A0AC35GED0_9BILA
MDQYTGNNNVGHFSEMEKKPIIEEPENLIRPQPLPFLSNFFNNFPGMNSMNNNMDFNQNNSLLAMQNQLALHFQQMYQNSSILNPPMAPSINPYFNLNFNQNLSNTGITTLPSAFRPTNPSLPPSTTTTNPQIGDDGDSGNETSSIPSSASPTASLPSRSGSFSVNQLVKPEPQDQTPVPAALLSTIPSVPSISAAPSSLTSTVPSSQATPASTSLPPKEQKPQLNTQIKEDEPTPKKPKKSK